MNKKGQGIIMGIMFFTMALIVAIIYVDPLSDLVDEVRTGLGCNDDGKTPGVYMTCIIIDLLVPFFIGVIIFSGSSLIIPRGGG